MSPRTALLALALPVFAGLVFPACGEDESSPSYDLGDAAMPDEAAVVDLSTPAPPPLDFTIPPRKVGDLANPAAGPPYPIVLVHGMAGFKNIGPIEYFDGVPEALRADGHDVWISQQDPINDSETRGKEVADFVLQVINATGKDKVNLIGHSQGGFDVRYVASTLPDYVAACVEIASPMKGDPIADLAASTGPGSQDALSALLNLYGALYGYDSDAQASIHQLTAAGAAAFFARHPDRPGVHYYSIAGRSAMEPAGGECDTPDEPDFIKRWDPYRDPLDVFFGVTSAILESANPRPMHDGVVPVWSAKHGTFLGCVPADHMDEVNQLAGDSPGLGNPFDAVQFYRDLADWLVAQGY